MDGNRLLVAAGVLATLFSITGCTKQKSDPPVAALRHGLDAYLASATNEPIDDKDNMARMRMAVEEIRREKLVDAVPVLLDVFLQYDATDNDVAGLARETLVEFGPKSLPAIEYKIAEWTKNNRDTIRETNWEWSALTGLRDKITRKLATRP